MCFDGHHIGRSQSLNSPPPGLLQFPGGGFSEAVEGEPCLFADYEKRSIALARLKVDRIAAVLHAVDRFSAHV
jgi:hypothetical protein